MKHLIYFSVYLVSQISHAQSVDLNTCSESLFKENETVVADIYVPSNLFVCCEVNSESTRRLFVTFKGETKTNNR